MQPIRVIFFLPTLDTGGTEKVVVDLCRYLPPLGYEIEVCTFSRGTYDALLYELGIRRSILVPGGIARRNPPALKLFRLLQRLARLKNAINRFQPQILHTHHLAPLFHADLLLRFGHRGVRWVHTEHSMPDLQKGYRFPPLRWSRSLRCPDVLTGVSPLVVQCLTELSRTPKQRTVLIPNGIELERFASAATASQPRSKLGLPQKGRLIGCVGNLRVEKNHQLVLRAMARLGPEEAETNLVLCGDGDQRSDLEALARSLGIENRVIFLGHRLDVPEILAALDLVLLPSCYEGLPLSVLEAWAASRPVLGTTVPGVQELIRHNEDGWLVPPEDPEQMADGILRILKDPGLGGRLSLSGRQRVFREYGVEAMVAGYDCIYRELIKGSVYAA